jgi:small nuclear ribonucleoprotein (snRNP)-like protein
MAKKQKSFADKASGNKNKDSVFVKYVRSIQSEETGGWRFNEQIIQMQKGEQLAAALKRMDQVANLVDIDLSQFSNSKENEDDNVEAKEELVLDGENNTSEEEE